MVFKLFLKTNLGVMCYLHVFRSLLKVLYVIKKTIEAIMCFIGVIEVLKTPQSFIRWSSQQCSPYHRLNLVYDLLISQRYQCIFMVG